MLSKRHEVHLYVYSTVMLKTLQSLHSHNNYHVWKEHIDGKESIRYHLWQKHDKLQLHRRFEL